MPYVYDTPPPRAALLSTSQAAAYLGIHRNTLVDYVDLTPTDRRHLACQRSSPPKPRRTSDGRAARLDGNAGRRWFTITDLEQWIARNLPAAPYPWEAKKASRRPAATNPHPED